MSFQGDVLLLYQVAVLGEITRGAALSMLNLFSIILCVISNLADDVPEVFSIY